jgi:hypothetical protein
MYKEREMERGERVMRNIHHQWLYIPLLGPGLFFSFVIFLQDFLDE